MVNTVSGVWRMTDPLPTADIERRDRILRSAAEAIAGKGAESVRLIDIAQSAGVSIGALQHHFGSRDVLVLEAYRLKAADALAAATELAGEHRDPLAALVAVIDFLGSEDDNDAASWIELCATAVRIPALQEIVDKINSTWADLVAGIVKRGVDGGAFTPSLEEPALLDAILVLLDGMGIAIASRRELPHRVRRNVTLTVATLVGAEPPRVKRRTHHRR